MEQAIPTYEFPPDVMGELYEKPVLPYFPPSRSQIAREMAGLSMLSIGLSAAGVLFVVPWLNRIVDDTDNETRCKDPVSTVAYPFPEEVDQSGQRLGELRLKVGEMEFGIDLQNYTDLKERIDKAESEQTVMRVLDKAFEPFDIEVKAEEPPEWTSFESYPDKLTLDQLKTAADGTLQRLSLIPTSLLRATDGRTTVYITNGLFDGAEDIAGGHDSKKGESAILLDARYGTGTLTLAHELFHELEARMCGTDYTPYKDFFGEINPEDFKYSKALLTQQRMAERKYVFEDYASLNPIEDFAVVGEYLTSGRYNWELKNSPYLQKKSDLLIHFLSAYEPRLREYFAYQGLLGGQIFPGDVARRAMMAGRGGGTYECFGVNLDDTYGVAVSPDNGLTYFYEKYKRDVVVDDSLGEARRIHYGVYGEKGDATDPQVLADQAQPVFDELGLIDIESEGVGSWPIGQVGRLVANGELGLTELQCREADLTTYQP